MVCRWYPFCNVPVVTEHVLVIRTQRINTQFIIILTLIIAWCSSLHTMNFAFTSSILSATERSQVPNFRAFLSFVPCSVSLFTWIVSLLGGWNSMMLKPLHYELCVFSSILSATKRNKMPNFRAFLSFLPCSVSLFIWMFHCLKGEIPGRSCPLSLGAW